MLLDGVLEAAESDLVGAMPGALLENLAGYDTPPAISEREIEADSVHGLCLWCC